MPTPFFNEADLLLGLIVGPEKAAFDLADLGYDRESVGIGDGGEAKELGGEPFSDDTYSESNGRYPYTPHQSVNSYRIANTKVPGTGPSMLRHPGEMRNYAPEPYPEYGETGPKFTSNMGDAMPVFTSQERTPNSAVAGLDRGPSRSAQLPPDTPGAWLNRNKTPVVTGGVAATLGSLLIGRGLAGDRAAKKPEKKHDKAEKKAADPLGITAKPITQHGYLPSNPTPQQDFAGALQGLQPDPLLMQRAHKDVYGGWEPKTKTMMDGYSRVDKAYMRDMADPSQRIPDVEFGRSKTAPAAIPHDDPDNSYYANPDLVHAPKSVHQEVVDTRNVEGEAKGLSGYQDSGAKDVPADALAKAPADDSTFLGRNAAELAGLGLLGVGAYGLHRRMNKNDETRRRKVAAWGQAPAGSTVTPVTPLRDRFHFRSRDSWNEAGAAKPYHPTSMRDPLTGQRSQVHPLMGASKGAPGEDSPELGGEPTDVEAKVGPPEGYEAGSEHEIPGNILMDNLPLLAGGVAGGVGSLMLARHILNKRRAAEREKRADWLGDQWRGAKSDAVNWAQNNENRVAQTGQDLAINAFATTPARMMLGAAVGGARAPKGYTIQGGLRGAGYGMGAGVGAGLGTLIHNVAGNPEDLGPRLLLQAGGTVAGLTAADMVLGDPSYDREGQHKARQEYKYEQAKREYEKLLAERGQEQPKIAQTPTNESRFYKLALGPLEALAAARTAGHKAPMEGAMYASRQYSDAGMPVRGAVSRNIAGLAGRQMLSEGTKYVSKPMRWGSAALGDAGGEGMDNIFELGAMFGDPRNIDKAVAGYEGNVARYRDEGPNPSDATVFKNFSFNPANGLLERAMRKTPRTVMNAGDVVARDHDIAAHRHNRDQHPGHYWLNPFVPGPLAEMSDRLKRRGSAEKADPDASFRGSLYIPGVPTARGLLGGHNAEKRDKARLLAGQAMDHIDEEGHAIMKKQVEEREAQRGEKKADAAFLARFTKRANFPPSSNLTQPGNAPGWQTPPAQPPAPVSPAGLPKPMGMDPSPKGLTDYAQFGRAPGQPFVPPVDTGDIGGLTDTVHAQGIGRGTVTPGTSGMHGGAPSGDYLFRPATARPTGQLNFTPGANTLHGAFGSPLTTPPTGQGTPSFKRVELGSEKPFMGQVPGGWGKTSAYLKQAAPPATSSIGQSLQNNFPDMYNAGHDFLNKDVGGAVGTGAQSSFFGGDGTPSFGNLPTWAQAGLIGAPVGAGIGLLGNMGKKRKKQNVMGDVLGGAALGLGAGALGAGAYSMFNGGDTKTDKPPETPATPAAPPPGQRSLFGPGATLPTPNVTRTWNNTQKALTHDRHELDVLTNGTEPALAGTEAVLNAAKSVNHPSMHGLNLKHIDMQDPSKVNVQGSSFKPVQEGTQTAITAAKELQGDPLNNLFSANRGQGATQAAMGGPMVGLMGEPWTNVDKTVGEHLPKLETAATRLQQEATEAAAKNRTPITGAETVDDKGQLIRRNITGSSFAGDMGQGMVGSALVRGGVGAGIDKYRDFKASPLGDPVRDQADRYHRIMGGEKFTAPPAPAPEAGGITGFARRNLNPNPLAGMTSPRPEVTLPTDLKDLAANSQIIGRMENEILRSNPAMIQKLQGEILAANPSVKPEDINGLVRDRIRADITKSLGGAGKGGTPFTKDQVRDMLSRVAHGGGQMHDPLTIPGAQLPTPAAAPSSTPAPKAPPTPKAPPAPPVGPGSTPTSTMFPGSTSIGPGTSATTSFPPSVGSTPAGTTPTTSGGVPTGGGASVTSGPTPVTPPAPPAPKPPAPPPGPTHGPATSLEAERSWWDRNVRGNPRRYPELHTPPVPKAPGAWVGPTAARLTSPLKGQNLAAGLLTAIYRQTGERASATTPLDDITGYLEKLKRPTVTPSYGGFAEKSRILGPAARALTAPLDGTGRGK